MPGAIYGVGYHELISHCFVYVHATEVGGTHPALIEAMGRGAVVLYLNTAENAEVAEGAAIAFEPGELAESLADGRKTDEREDRASQEQASGEASHVAATHRYSLLETAEKRLISRLGRRGVDSRTQYPSDLGVS